MEYWTELRRRLLRCIVYFTLCFSLLFYYRITWMDAFLAHFANTLPQASHFVLTSVTSAIFFSVQLVLDVSLFLTLPYCIFEAWRFVLPALYQVERRVGAWFLIGSQVLLVLGMVFAYLVILPAIWGYMVQMTPQSIPLMLDIQNTLNFMMRLLLIFGLFFQLPLLCLGLVRWGLFSVQQLKSMRRYVIVLAFIVGMLLAPPDVFSQTLIALPLWGLFEIGVATACVILPKTDKMHSV